ncbi:hypothetical protein LJB42_003407 [Komagataella kurtzmanii]|nr:hypothetical protein LJB42_003407 [Komagataella kurtzmanii]
MKISPFVWSSLIVGLISGLLALEHPQFKEFSNRTIIQHNDLLERNQSASRFDKPPKLYGVALGGWLVLEPYITPSLFNDSVEEPVDEYTLCHKLGNQKATEVLKKHWSTFITESDIIKIKNVGLNSVRIPIGYWAYDLLEDDPYIQGQDELLSQCIDWCAKHGLSVWIDLHGAPSSQNGFDNSGRRGRAGWQDEQRYIDKTLYVLETIAKRHGNKSNVVGIEILNEPFGPVLNIEKLKQFYQKGITVIRNTGYSKDVVISDAFQGIFYWNDFQPSDSNLILDRHHYEVFSDGQLRSSFEGHLRGIEAFGRAIAIEKPTVVVGEWSAAITDCAPWVNGAGRPSRYHGMILDDGTAGDCSGATNTEQWAGKRREEFLKIIETSLKAYNAADGWFFWCWKTESALEWDMEKLLHYALFPSGWV